MVPKIPSDPHRSHGIPQLKLSTLVADSDTVHGPLWGRMVGSGRAVGSMSTSSKMWSVVGDYKDDKRLREQSKLN